MPESEKAVKWYKNLDIFVHFSVADIGNMRFENCWEWPLSVAEWDSLLPICDSSWHEDLSRYVYGFVARFNVNCACPLHINIILFASSPRLLQLSRAGLRCLRSEYSINYSASPMRHCRDVATSSGIPLTSWRWRSRVTVTSSGIP